MIKKILSSKKLLIIFVFSFVFICIATKALAALTFSANDIASNGALTFTTPNGITSLQPLAIGADAVLGVGADGAGYASLLNISKTFTDAAVGVEPLSISTTADFSADGGSIYAFANYTRVPSSNSKNLGAFFGEYAVAEHAGSGNASDISSIFAVARNVGSGDVTGEITGGNFNAIHAGSGSSNGMNGIKATASHNGSGNMASQIGARIYSRISSGASASATVNSQYGATVAIGTDKSGTSITNDYGVWVNSFNNGGTITNSYGLYITDIASIATNPYYSWFDSRGVGRCREDATFNSVGQSICVVYNPQFTKYTAGAVNYERTVYGQWNSNVAEIGTEAGGTGTLRPLRLLGTETKVSGKLVVENSQTPASSSATCTTGTIAWDAGFVYVCTATNTWKRSALATW